jgi:Acetylornithine deacetylase/Succinyl-diaminopimelate desuccinylase and related deacylases
MGNNAAEPSANKRFHSLLKNTYLHTLIGNAIKTNMPADELIDRIIQAQSATNELISLELSSLRKAGDSFYCLFKSSSGDIALKYSVFPKNGAPQGVFTIGLDGGQLVGVEETDLLSGPGHKSIVKHYKKDPDQLLKEILSKPASLRRDGIKRFLEATASCSCENMEYLLQSYPIDLTSSESCYINILIAGGILKGLASRLDDRSRVIYDKAVSVISDVIKGGNISKNARSRLDYYAGFFDEMPTLYKLLGYYRKFISSDPPYFIEALEMALYKAGRETKRDESKLAIVNALSASKNDTLALIELFVKSALSHSVVTRSDISAAISVETAERLFVYDEREIEAAVKIIAQYYENERSKVMPDILFRADAGMVFSHNNTPYVFLSNFKSEETLGFRSNEIAYNREWFRRNKYRCIEVPPEYPFEGSSEIHYVRRKGKATMIMNQGPRTSPEAIEWIGKSVHRIINGSNDKIDILKTFTVTEEFAHLSKCLVAIPVIENGNPVGETIMYYPEAFDDATQKALRDRYSDGLILGVQDAQNFAADSIVIGDAIIVDHRISTGLEKELASRGLKVLRIDLSEFTAAGGGASSLVLQLKRDLFDMGLTKNNCFQIADSAQGVFGSRYITNERMEDSAGITDEKKAEAQRTKLFNLMHENGAVMVPFETRRFSMPFDFSVLSQALEDFKNSKTVQDEFKKTLPVLTDKLGGIIGIGSIIGAFPDGFFQVDLLEEILKQDLSSDDIKNLNDVRYLQRFFKRLFMSYQERYSNPSEFSFPAVKNTISLGSRSGVMPESLTIDGKSVSTPEKLWPFLLSCIQFEQFLERIFDEESNVLVANQGKVIKDNGVADIESLGDLKKRMESRANAKESFARFSEFIDKHKDGSGAARYVEMYSDISDAKDADLAGASDAALRCFKSFEEESLYRQFIRWRDRSSKAPPYLFFVVYDLFGRLPEDSIRIMQETVFEKPKAPFATSDEVHHRIINAFANIVINHSGSRAAEALYHIFDLGKGFKEGEQLKMAEHIAQLSETLSFQAKIHGSNEELLQAVVNSKTYEEFSAMLGKRNIKAAFEHIGIDHSKFSLLENATYESKKKDLDEMFSALIVNKNFRDRPFMLLLVKLAYVAIIKDDMARIKYDTNYLPDYLDTFFNPKEVNLLKVFFYKKKNGSGSRIFSSLARKGILKVWREDNKLVVGSIPESFSAFISSIVKDYLERGVEYAPQFVIDISNLPRSREGRGPRAAHLNRLGRDLDHIIKLTGTVEILKDYDIEVYKRIISLPDDKSQMDEVQKIYNTVSREQKLLVMANFRDEVFDADKGVERTLQGYRATINAAVDNIRNHRFFAGLAPEAQERILPKKDDISSIVNFSADNIKSYEKVINDPETWQEVMKMIDAIKRLSKYLEDLAKKCEQQRVNAVYVNELPLSYYYDNLAKKINNISACSSENVELGVSGDPLVIMKALRGECYDYRDGLNSDVLMSMFYNPLLKVGYARKASDAESFLANQVFVLSEINDENSRSVPAITADFFYGSRMYEAGLTDMMLFYKCTPVGIELNIPIEHEEVPGQSGQASLAQTTIFKDESLDVFLDITYRIPIARMSDVERLIMTVIQPPFTATESRKYIEKNKSAQAFYDEHIAPRDNFQEIYTKALSDIVRIPSDTSNAAGVNKVADYMAAKLKEHGFTVERVSESAQGLGDHIVFKRIVGQSMPTVLFSGHMDTVYKDKPQVEAEIRQGKIFGPGVMDMKGGLIVMLAVIKKLENEGLIDEVNIVGVLNSDEESGSKTSREVIEELAGSYPTGLALVFEFNKNGKIILSRQGIGHFGRAFSDPDAAERFSGIVRNLSGLTGDDNGDRVNVGKIRAVDPRKAPAGYSHVARYSVNVTSAAGHAGARKNAGNRDSNFEIASKMDAVEEIINENYSGRVRIYHRFLEGGSVVNQLSSSAHWIFDLYADATLSDTAIEKLKAEVQAAAKATYAPETSTSLEETRYSEESIWEDPKILWGDAAASVKIEGEYRFAVDGRDAALKLKISEFLGQVPKEPHRPVMREHQLAKNILSIIGYGGHDEFNMSAADSNFISNMKNSKGELIPTFDGVGLTGDGAHSREQMEEWALLSSLGERTDLSLALIKQLLAVTSHSEGMSLNSVRKVGLYKGEELAILSITKDYALRKKENIFALQSSDYDIFELEADDLIADRWKAGTAGNSSEISFPAKWEHSYAMINEGGDIIAVLLAYENRSDALSGTGDSVRIQYLLVDPRYRKLGIEKDLIVEAAKALNEKGSYRTLSGRGLKISCAVNDSNKEILESIGFMPQSGSYEQIKASGIIVYDVSAEEVVARASVVGEEAVVEGTTSAVASEDIIAEKTNDFRPVELSSEPVPELKKLLNTVKGFAGRQIPGSDSVFVEAFKQSVDQAAENRTIVMFSDNLILDNAIPPYEMYEMCKSHGISLWIVVKNGAERQKIESLGFSESVNFIEIGQEDLFAEDNHGHSQLASEYNLLCADKAISYMREKAGVSGKIVLVTNPFNISDQNASYTKERFGRVSARSRTAIIVPQIPMSAGSVVYADMLIAYAVGIMNNQGAGNGPLVIVLPPIKNLNEHIRDMIERFNAERHVVLAA